MSILDLVLPTTPLFGMDILILYLRSLCTLQSFMTNIDQEFLEASLGEKDVMLAVMEDIEDVSF